jgi:hypothetical protein
VPYIRTVKASSGATAVQIVYSYHRGSRQIEHIGSAHDDAELELLKAVARQRLAAGQGVLDLGPGFGSDGGAPLPITASRMGMLLDALVRGYEVLGFGRAADSDAVFAGLVLARIIEPASKLDSLRVLEEAGVAPASYATLKRRLRVYAREAWRQKLSAACAMHAGLGRASLVLFDVSTLYFETDEGDGFRQPGFSKGAPPGSADHYRPAHRSARVPADGVGVRGQPRRDQDDAAGHRGVHDRARPPDVTVVADAGMISEANQKQIEGAGLSFILGARIPHVPYLVAQWRREHPGEPIPDGHVFSQHWPAEPNGSRRDQVIYYQYRHDRARRTLRGIDEQVRRAEQAVAGNAPVKRNRFIQLAGGTRTVNRDLEDKARALPGLKGYVTNLHACPDGTPVTAEFVIGAYHQLFQIEKSFRMAKSDLQARPIYHHLRDSIEAHLTIVFAALAVSRWIEEQTG